MEARSRPPRAEHRGDRSLRCGHAFFDPDDPFASGLCAARNEIVAGPDFLGLSGAVRLMTLSGCSTGVNDVHPGDELLGSARASVRGCGIAARDALADRR
jgi:CHAT domain-containing protein